MDTTLTQERTVTRTQWIILFSLILIGVFLRFTNIDVRPVHHDESLHAMYGRYFYDWPEFNYYKYDPMLHGPFIYNLMRITYSTLGSSTWAARTVIAMFGSIFLFLPWVFRRYYSTAAMIGLTAAIALSPTLTYWARFIREDTLILAAISLMLYGCIGSRPSYRWILGLLAVSIQCCLKENVFVTLALLTGFIVYEELVRFVTKRSETTLIRDMINNLCQYKVQAIVGLLVAVFFFCYLFSEGFRYPHGIVAFFQDSVTYWMKQHNIERIKGPFNFHIYTLSWYELPFIIAVLFQLSLFYSKANKPIRAAGVFSLLALILACLFNLSNDIEKMPFWQLFKLKDVLDIAGLIFLVTQSVIITTQHLLQKERALAFWGYLFYASFFTYSYLGEKVPWLTVYAFVPGLIYLALYFDYYYHKYPINNWREFAIEKIFSYIGIILFALSLLFAFGDGLTNDNLFFFGFACLFFAVSFLDFIPNLLGRVNLKIFLLAIFCIYSVRANLLTNFIYAGEAREYISQVHTTKEFHDTVRAIKAEVGAPVKGFKPGICASGEMVWPITWYLTDTPEYKFPTPDNPNICDNLDYKFVDPEKANDHPGYRRVDLKLRGWWVPDFSKMNLKNFLNYSLNHTNWSDVGYQNTTLLVKDK